MAKQKSFLGVSAVEISQNSKIGTVSATYASQKTCPNAENSSHACALYKSGCYAETGNVGFQTSRLNRQVDGVSIQELAQNEADAIAGLTGRFPLRLHVVGDCVNNAAASTVAAAASKHRAKHSQPVWTYTHAWRDVSRKSWRDVSVLASCETTKDVKRATRKGYATALVVAQHAQPTAYRVDGVKLIPCPQQTGKTASCETCKLCFNADRLLAMGATIAFATHGSSAKKANEALVQISGI